MIQTETDIALLIDESLDEAAQCEHQNHGRDPRWHADGNEHYVRTLVVECNHQEAGRIYVVCGQWLTSPSLECAVCGREMPLTESVKDLGPVKDYK